MRFAEVPRLSLAHCPTPLWRHHRLDEEVGCEVWVKRDDVTAGAAAGNKIRKLEFLLAQAVAQGANCIVTCGAAQSNHARATALCCAQLGLRCHLVLRTADPSAEPNRGNLFLDRWCGAQIHWVSPEQYRKRHSMFDSVEQPLRQAGLSVYRVEEGGSSPMGSLGYVRAMEEVRQQLDLPQVGVQRPPTPSKFDTVVHACGSGGTSAGTALGAAKFSVAPRVHSIVVCDDNAHFQGVVTRLIQGVQQQVDDLHEVAELEFHDDFIGPGYGIASDPQRKFLQRIASTTGLILDPVYSGKALYGLSQLRLTGQKVLFLHTGGLPGLLAQSEELGNWVPAQVPSID